MNTNTVFPTPQQLADMLLAANCYVGASSVAEEETNGQYFISLTVERDGKRFYDGFWYMPEFADMGEFVNACKRIAEVSEAVQQWVYAL